MEHKKQKRVTEEITRRASEYLARELGVHALVTVTRAETSPDLKRAIIFFSVLPSSEESEVLTHTRRLRSDFREHLMKKSKLQPVPTIDFQIDIGEKNRQRISTLTEK